MENTHIKSTYKHNFSLYINNVYKAMILRYVLCYVVFGNLKSGLFLPYHNYYELVAWFSVYYSEQRQLSHMFEGFVFGPQRK